MADDGWKKLEEPHPDAVQLDADRIACGLHRLPFRARWPLGFAIFTVRAFQEVTALDGIWDEAKSLLDAAARIALGDAPLGPRALEPVLDKRPACCRFSAAQLAALYAETNIGAMNICSVCGLYALGTPINATNQHLAHLCFVCMSRASATDPRLS